MGSLMMQRTKDLYPDTKIISFSIFPSEKVSDIVVEEYNATLTLQKLQEYCDGIFVIDNESLFNISENIYKKENPKLSDLNFVCDSMINDITSIFRFDDSYGFNVNSFLYEMVKYPKLKYFCPSRVPFYDENDELLDNEKYEDSLELTKRLFDRKYSFVCYNPKSDRGQVERGPYGDIDDFDFDDDDDDVEPEQVKQNYVSPPPKPYIATNMSTLIIHRGFDKIENKDFIKTMEKDENVVYRKFEDNVISTVIKDQGYRKSKSMSCISNSTLMTKPLGRITSVYARYYQRKAFLHWYKGEGMEEYEFQQADQCVRDVLRSYRKIENPNY